MPLGEKTAALFISLASQPTGNKQVSRRIHSGNLVIHLGTNDLKDDPHDVTLKIIKLLERTKLIFPTTSIYFSSILPKYNTKLFPRINYINGNVYSFCERVQIKYKSHHIFATKDHEINTDLFRKDMLHPSRKGTKQLAKNIISVYRGKPYY